MKLVIQLTLVSILIVLTGAKQAHSQIRKVDSLYAVLKTEKEDTNKVNTFNELAGSYVDNIPSKSDSLARLALKLAQTLHFKSGEGLAYKTLGSALLNQGNYAEALKYEQMAMAIVEQLGNKTLLARIHMTIGDAYEYQSNFSEAIKNLNTAYNLFKETGYKKGMGNALGDIGIVYFMQGNYPQSLNNELQSLAIDEQVASKADLEADYGNIGVIYYHLQNYPEALNYYAKSLKLSGEINDKRGLGATYANIGNVYSELKNYDSAMRCHQLSLKLCQEVNDVHGEAVAYGNIGSIYAIKQNFSEALKASYEALKINKQIGNQDGIALDYGNLGSIFMKQKQFAPAKAYIDSSIVAAKILGSKDGLKSAYISKTELDSAMGNFKDAYESFKMSIVYRDSLNNEENTKKLVQEQMNYEFSKKEAMAKAEQDKKDAMAAADKKRQQIITGSVSIGLVLVLVFSFLLFSRYRVAKKQKTIIEEQKLVVEEKNKEVLDSITYAKRLQDAILPPLSLIGQYLPDSLILYKPKDIVAGDFYWVQPLPDSILVAACDCTGHGVPGAMVSVVCSNALNRAVKEFKITEPGKILDKTRELVMETFEKSEGEIKDGMDISLAAISCKPSANGSVSILWSGAYNPLWHIHSGEIKELTGDKQPIGKHVTQQPFSTHSLQLSKGDSLYLFTDGYADQFGGPKGKKFKYKALKELITANVSKPLKEQKKLLDSAFENWKGNMEQTDDVCIIGIRI